MITKVTTISELKQLFFETLMSNTDKVSKISKGSVNNAIAYGVCKIGQKALKDVALVESHKFPSFAFGTHLDDVAADLGIAPRFGESSSSVYLYVCAAVGTVYLKNTTTFTGSHGVVFQMELDSVTISSLGYEYIKVRSTSLGEKTNVDALSITEAQSPPTGHTFVLNEVKASGGRDSEVDQDDVFRMRIKDGVNIAAIGTIAALTQAFMKINNNVLRLLYYGINDNGKIRIAIITQNGIDLTTTEIGDILEAGEEFLSLTDLRPYGVQLYGVELVNPVWQSIDIDYRARLTVGADIEVIRKETQRLMSKYIDYRFWDHTKKVEWDNLLQIAKNVKNVDYISDADFTPRVDITVQKEMLPRIRSFIIRDLDGAILTNVSSVLNPVYFQNQQNYSYQSTVLKSIAWL